MNTEIIAIVNQKGGVAKTTTALAIGAGLRRMKKRVLFIDLDAQCNLTTVLGAAGSAPFSVLDVLTEHCSANDAIFNNLIAASPSLAAADLLLNTVGKEYRLKEALESVCARYDFIVVDTPPALSTLSINALTAATCVLIPSQADYFSLSGISQLGGTLQTVRRYTNPNLRILGILLTRYAGRSVLSRDMADHAKQIAQQLGTKVFETKIRECVALKEAQALNTDIFTHAPKSNGAADYSNFLEELMKEF